MEGKLGTIREFSMSGELNTCHPIYAPDIYNPKRNTTVKAGLLMVNLSIDQYRASVEYESLDCPRRHKGADKIEAIRRE
jgi:hypothetical protein